VDAGDYDLSEDGPPGYTASAWECVGGTQSGSSVTVPNGGDVTCTITNDDQPAQLSLVKVVEVGDPPTPAAPADWTLTADGPTPVTGPGNSDAVTDQPVDAGSYDLSEDGPPGFTASAWECVGGEQAGSAVTVPVGGDVTCTITNSAEPRWTLDKTSDPASGSTVDPGDEITYTITATKLAGVEDPTDIVVTDDLSAVLDNATLVEGSIEASTGTAELDGEELVWAIDVLSGTETLSYTVRVNEGAYGVRLRNAITGTGPVPPEECVPPDTALSLAALRADADPCSTDHRTPPTPVTPTPTPTPPTTPPSTPPAPTGPTSQGSGLASTGGPAGVVVWGGLLLIALGGGLVVVARRRRAGGSD
jgi:fimbrial isopeptide formation D2 family protein